MMRIALDLQACQTESRHRGIGRYSLDFTRALVAGDSGAEFLVCLDGTYADVARELVEELQSGVPRAAFSRYFYPGPTRPHGDMADILRPAAGVLASAHYAALSADVVHVNSLFEGFVEHAGGVEGAASAPGAISSVTLYDFIPLVFASKYLANPEYAAWYARKLAELERFDVFLCISEATRADAIRLLGLEPERLAVIHAGVGSEFVPLTWEPTRRAAFLSSMGIRDKYVLYTGNGDFRKNLRGAIEAFALVPPAERKNVQLVFNQVDGEATLRKHAESLGLARDELVITGKVSDKALIGLFQNCHVFFFPSLYEGFGLPVLEAMACGAPTISADNSSLKEVVARADAMFDAGDSAAVSRVLSRSLNDDAFRSSLRESGIRRAAEYSWDRTAILALNAWREAHERKEQAKQEQHVLRKPRRRVAMVTPLPPERTGIADYISELLLPLSRYLDIDIFTTATDVETVGIARQFRIRHWSELPERATEYEAVVYQFGNSPFHSHMLDLLDQVPGIVVLHDVFLSSMLWHMDEHERRPGLFAGELARSHGASATTMLAAEGESAARSSYPASLRVLQSATAVVVHSQHSANTIIRWFPFARRAKLYKAPMPLRLATTATPLQVEEARSRLGIGPQDFLILSFGFIADTKLSHLLLDAVELLAGRVLRPMQLVFVGANDGGPYGQAIVAKAGSLEGRANVQITGFADESLYRDYLVAGDVAIQLRASSRGETSKAVYDCLATGLATIVNDYGSFAEIPSQCVRKLPAQPDAVQLANILEDLIATPNARDALRSAGLDHVRMKHSPSTTSRVYAHAVEETLQLERFRNGNALVSGIADAIGESGASDAELAAIEHAIDLRQRDDGVPRLLLDLSEIVEVDYATGVHRVVRNMARELLLLERPTLLNVDAVSHGPSGQLRSADGYVAENLGIVPHRREAVVEWCSGDVLMLLDSAWERTERFDASISGLHAAGGRVGTFVHDLIPLRFPQYCVDYMPRVFEAWLRYVVSNCDFMICNSKATANDLHDWIQIAKPTVRDGQRIGYAHLGSDLVERQAQGQASNEMHAVCKNRPFLMVGTIEPRKGYQDALAAFELAWGNGADLSLVMVGKRGWNVEHLIDRILRHEQLGKRLHWFESVSDADLAHAYANARGFVQASHAEGFGLPIVEAARYRLPLLLSDIPPFREIAGTHALFHGVGNVSGLAANLAAPLPEPPPADLGISWRESASRMMELIMKGGWMY